MAEVLIGSNARRSGICYRCMFGSHKHCYGDSNKTVCDCRRNLHNLKATKRAMGMNPDLTPPAFPEDPTHHDRFYFIPMNTGE